MGNRTLEIRHTISNVGLGRQALTNGIDSTRKYLEDIGAKDGLAWTPTVRSLLYAEILAKTALGTYANVVDGVGIIASMDQSFAPTIPEAWRRYRSRAGVMPWQERTRRLGVDVVKQRGVMPPVLSSLLVMKRLAGIVADEALFGNLYAEELQAGKTYNDTNAPYTRSTHITPDVVEKLNTTIYRLPEELNRRGITKFSFDPYNAERSSQSGRTQLPPWESYLADFARQGLIRQITISLNRGDLPASSGMAPMVRTHQLAHELIRDSAAHAVLGPLPEQIACIIENQPAGQILDFTINGDVSGLSRPQLRNAYHNLGTLVPKL